MSIFRFAHKIVEKLTSLDDVKNVKSDDKRKLQISPANRPMPVN